VELEAQDAVAQVQQTRAGIVPDLPVPPPQNLEIVDPGIRGHRIELRELDEVPLARSRDLHRLLGRIVTAVEKKKLDPQQAYAIGWLVQLLLQTLRGVEKERDYHRQHSYGQLVGDAFRELRGGETDTSEEEYGPDEAEETEWDPER